MRRPPVPAALLVLATAACGADATAPATPVPAPGAVRMAFAGAAAEEGAPLACGADVPVTVSVTTTDRRGRTVPAPGFLVNFRAVDGASSVFAGAALTNAAGQASDRLTVTPYPGTQARLEVRSVEAGTGVPTTHLTLSRNVVMGAAAAVTARGTGFSLWGYPYLRVEGSVSTDCALPGGQRADLPAGTPFRVESEDGRYGWNGTLGAGASSSFSTEGPYAGGSGTYRLTVGSPTTGVVTTTFSVYVF